MYEANGIATEFPLPYGSDGKIVVLVSPEGEATRMKEGEAYTVQTANGGGAVFFCTPPPAGWTVAFDLPSAATVATGKKVCTVIYPDGTIKEVEQDPWLLLAAVRRTQDEVRELLDNARKERQAVSLSIKALADETKEDLKARLFNYNDRAESTIAAAVRATSDETAATVNKHLVEIRNKHKQVLGAYEGLQEMTFRAETAAGESASRTAALLQEEISCTCSECKEIYERLRTMESGIREMRDEAKNAAADAGRELTRTFERRAETLLQEIKSVKSALDNEIKEALRVSSR